MMETEQRMLKGFVTAATLSSEDIDAMDKSVRRHVALGFCPSTERADALDV
jgi:hypothetical protein